MSKTISFALLHTTVAFSVAYLMTGSFVIGGAIALVEPLVNTIVYFFHEKYWASKESAQNNHVVMNQRNSVVVQHS